MICIVDHQVERLLIRHSHGVQADVQNRIRENAQQLFQPREAHPWIIIKIALVRHELLHVNSPTLDIGSVAEYISQQAARFRLTFSMAYFLPVGQVRRALFQSAQRGVRMRVVLPSFSDMPFIQRATRYFYDVLLRRRFEVFERQQRMLHSKVLIMDDEYVVLGSSNFDVRSLWINWEFVALIRSRHLAALMTEVVNREARQSVRVTKSFWRNQSWWQRLLDRIAWSLRLWL